MVRGRGSRFGRGTGRGTGQGGYHGKRPNCSKCNRHHFPHEQCRATPTHATGRGHDAGRAPGTGQTPASGHGRAFHHSIGNLEFNATSGVPCLYAWTRAPRTLLLLMLL